MKFTDQKEFMYDPALFTRLDTNTALKIYREYIHRHGAQSQGVPAPKFFEVDRFDPKICAAGDEAEG